MTERRRKGGGVTSDGTRQRRGGRGRALGRRALGRSGAGLALAAACILLGAAPAAAQEEAVDSTSIRLRERLRLLRLPPGDSSQALPSDSTPEALTGFRVLPDSAAARVRPGDMVGALRALPGYSVAQYRGTSAEYRAQEGLLFLYGDTLSPAQLERVGDRLQADSMIRFDEAANLVEARGSPVFVPAQGDEVRSGVLFWNLEAEEGSALDARTRYSEGANWIVNADMPLIRSDLAYGHKARFTSCELDVPHYHFETDQLKIVAGSILVARPVRLYFGDVPVAWLPFVAQSLARGRASGLLTPRFSVNDIVRTSGGYRRRVSNLGFYWAMSDYSDASVAFDWFDDNYIALTGGIQYNWLRQFMRGSLDLRRFWRAEGGTELTLNTRHSWEFSERTSFRMSGAYASSSQFVTQNSFNPQELTRSIDSDGGINHRFDWGSLSLSANRRQYLTDDRVEMTLPDLSLSMSPVTLFGAAPGRESWYNNVTWSGSGSVRRQIRDFADDADSYDQGSLSASGNSSLNVGDLTVSGNMRFSESSALGVPRDSLPFFPAMVAEQGIAAFFTPEGRRAAQEGAEPSQRVDVSGATLDWSTSVSYQQGLIGSTTLTPRVTVSGRALRSDTARFAQDFVQEPNRISFGAGLRTDFYGFFPGVGGFERIRHKLSPSFSYDFSPEVTPTELQRRIFGTRAAQPTKVVSVTLNQTFEAKREIPDDTAAVPVAAPDTAAAPADSAAIADLGPEPPFGAGGTAEFTEDGLRRRQTGEVVKLLGLTTSAVTYDLVQADSTGEFLQGFQTMTLSNTITSDYLRGLQINMSHDLWDDGQGVAVEEGGEAPRRRFDPHLSRLNLGFSLSNRSAIFRLLGLGGDPSAPEPEEPLPPEEDPLEPEEDVFGGVGDEASMIPQEDRAARRERSPASVGQWSANFSYALNRPRTGGQNSQMIQGNLSLQPTENWEMTWRTGYDLEVGEFSDHIIRLTRDLHRWQAHFDFLQTATGNWTFRFEVQLLDNQDLRFEHEQRNLEPRTRR